MESDVVEGFLDGIYKEYFFLKKELQIISNVKNNMSNGLSMEFFENGRVKTLSLAVNNYFFDSYQYDENGKLINKRIWLEEEKSLLELDKYRVRVTELRKEYDLEQINEEILRDGSILNMKNTLENRQEELRKRICLDNKIDVKQLYTIAGVDLAYWKEDNKEYACCCIVVLDFENLSVIEKKYRIGEITIPYIPGCLAFREYELVEKTVQLLENEVDLYVFDGNGFLHPRHMGLATYAGIMLEKPSIGVAKSFYKFAEVDYSDLLDEDFAYKDIVIKSEVYGRVIRTHKGVKPIFLSIGNMINLETATKITEKLIDKESHIPVLTRYADIMTHEIRRQSISE